MDFKTQWRLPYGAPEYLLTGGIRIIQDEGKPLIPHSHPVSAILRNHCEDLLLHRVKGKRVKSVGGNDVRHAKRHSHCTIHSCCPVLDGMDAIREARRTTYARGMRCANKFQECDWEADAYLFSHSMYYIEREDLSYIPSGKTILATHNVYPGPGEYTFGEATVHLSGGMEVVATRGNDHPYRHKPVWLRSECVVTTGYTTIAFCRVFTLGVAHAYVGVVQPARITDQLLECTEVPYECETTELEQHLIAEAAGTSVTARTLHVLQMRARTFCNTRNIPIPANIDALAVRSLNTALQSTIAAWNGIDEEAVRENNRIIAEMERLEAESPSLWSRAGLLLWNVCTLTWVVSVMAYTMPTSHQRMRTLYNHSRARVVGGFTRFMRQFTHVPNKMARWFQSRWFNVPTYVPANNYENELTSIFNRSMPPDQKVVISPSIRTAARRIAALIGPVNAPLDFDQWVSRFTPQRQAQIRAARLQPLNASVEYFQKIEQLDEAKEPRAIQARVDEFKATLGPWIAALEHQAREQLPFFVKGLAPSEQAKRIAELGNLSENALEIDFSRFDRSLSAPLLLETEHLIYEQCLPASVAAMMRKQLSNHVRTRNNASYMVEGTRMSGDVNTSIGNCLVNACLMLATGIPISHFIVEGDDMLAALDNKTRDNMDIGILASAGLTPKIKILPFGEAEFCSRKVIRTTLGPKRCRDPRREIRRTGFSIHSETESEKLTRGVLEWEGIPMFGPLYQTLSGLPITRVSNQAREDFERCWDVSRDEQIKFETDAEFRERFAAQLAAPDARPPRDGISKVQRAVRPSDERHLTDAVRPGKCRTATPGRQGQDVRDIPPKGTSQGAIQSGGGSDGQWGSAYRRRLRRKRLRAELPGHSSVVSKEHDPRLERLNPHGTAKQGHETKVANNSVGHGPRSGKQTTSKLP